MKVVDKEQERLAEEGTPEGKKKALMGTLIPIAIVAVCAIVYFCFPDFTIGGGKAYVVTLGNVEVIPGQTTVQELADAGYDFSDLSGANSKWDDDGSLHMLYPNVYDLTSEAEANTLYISIVLVKDQEQVASLSLVNMKSKGVPISECVISDISVAKSDYESDKATLMGLSFDQISEEALTEEAGKPKSTPDYSDDVTWGKGKYGMGLVFDENGAVESFSSDYNVH